MAQYSGEPKLIVPALGPIYAAAADLWYPMIRITASVLLFCHGWPKIERGIDAVAASMARGGFEPAYLAAALVMITETVGAICIALGLLTRFFAAGATILMAVIFTVHWPHGFSASRGGYEYVLLWGIVFFAIALRGGGSYSLDRLIGREL
jgi:putative oxidoreductase